MSFLFRSVSHSPQMFHANQILPVQYIIERYDTTHRLSFTPGTTDYYQAKQWLFFQMSGQGPYYGQASWFSQVGRFHPEKVPSAIERYVNEVNRVTGVLEEQRLHQKEKYGTGPWIVGGKYSFVDISFLAWQSAMPRILSKE